MPNRDILRQDSSSDNWARRRLLSVAALATPIGFLSRRALTASAPAKSAELVVATDGDLLAFKPDQLTCPAHARVHLTFVHAGRYITQDHNWVLTIPGAADSVQQAALAAGEGNGWVPRGDSRVLAATPSCGKGARVTTSSPRRRLSVPMHESWAWSLAAPAPRRIRKRCHAWARVFPGAAWRSGCW